MRVARVRVERMLRGLRQKDLAVRINLSQSTISRVESGRKAVRPDEAGRIARALGVESPSELFDGVRARMIRDGEFTQ